MSTDQAMKLLPEPRRVQPRAGSMKWNRDATLSLGLPAEGVGAAIARQWREEQGGDVRHTPSLGCSLTIGKPDDQPPHDDLSDHPEGYVLDITAQGVRVLAAEPAGVLYAWQTLRQLLRQFPAELPALRIIDEPNIRWRVYHLDLKGTRRTLANLHAILPQLAELKVNALLVEYEDYLRLDRHPELAVPDALSKADAAGWIAEAKSWNVHIIPLVQTLGHLQYVLVKPEYEHLREKADDPGDACHALDETWTLVTDFLDEIIELHPDAPYIHAGLDEAHNFATCDRCKAAANGRSKAEMLADWINRVARYVHERGFKPIAWADMITNEGNSALAARLDPCVVLGDWSYSETQPTTPRLGRFKGSRISRQWLRRPNGPISELPRLGFGGKGLFIEDLSEDDLQRIRPDIDCERYPLYVRSMLGQKILSRLGFETFGTAGIKISAHGCVTPKFITGQLNVMNWSAFCKESGASGVIGTSWSRGHSLAGMNAHPELDWYGIATLGHSAWAQLDFDGLRDFDERFAYQFFGLPDGEIGDLYYLTERSSPRVDHVMDDYTQHITDRLEALRPLVTRHADCFDLYASCIGVQRLRYEAQFALLELEYFHAIWDRQAEAQRKRIRENLANVVKKIDEAGPRLVDLYARTITQADARELVETQLGFLRRQVELASTACG